MCFQVIATSPRGAVNALKLGVLLAPAPVGRSRAHQLKGGDQPRSGHVRAATQVEPFALAGLGIDVVIHRQLCAAHFHDVTVDIGATLEANQFQFVRLVRQFFARGFIADYAASKTLALLDDLLHALFNGLEVIGCERGLHVEVVVEAVINRRANAQLRAGVDVLNSLGQNVRGRVTHHHEAIG
ncbi:unannotated protein [freshwater metagenome]|uniref:Unannotated protein n=1 Tax=freshwater metagenome TaxID=449393 RepID=A0A6J6VVL4_9ZZZZ